MTAAAASPLPRLGAPDDLATFVTEHYFPVSGRTIRREWRVRYGLKFVSIGGRSLASYQDVAKIAEISRAAPPVDGSNKGRAAALARGAKSEVRA